MVWNNKEREAWQPERKLSPSEWAAKYRYLPPSMSNESGRWRNERTPYLIDIHNECLNPYVEQIVILKASQIGFSECIRNILGYWIDQDPGPALLVMPSAIACKQLIEERIKPLLYDTKQLRRHISSRSDDTTLNSIKLDSMSLYVATSGSPQSLADRPIRYLLCDEVDKYPAFSGREADPISLALKRLTTFLHRARSIMGSTPTNRDGKIWRLWERCNVQLYYHVPCPVCKRYQVLTWTNVKYPKIEGMDKPSLAEEIEVKQLAYYECPHCHHHILDGQKQSMLIDGVWAELDAKQDSQGKPIRAESKAKRVGFTISAIYSPWVSFSKLAAEWLLADGDIGLAMDFRNSRLAEVFEIETNKVSTSDIRNKANAAKPRGDMPIVPAWAGGLYATVDVQKDRFYYVIRAWGHAFKSQLIHYGIAYTFDELRSICLDAPYEMESGGATNPQILAIDSGYRTHEIYEFAKSDASRIFALKGDDKIGRGPFHKHWQKQHGIYLLYVQVPYYKDKLTSLITNPDQDKWQVYGEVASDPDYIQQMSSEHKIFDPKRKKETWQLKQPGSANHWYDCEVYSCAIAEMTNVAIATMEYEVNAGDEPQTVELITSGTKKDNTSTPSNSNTETIGIDWINSWRGKY